MHDRKLNTPRRYDSGERWLVVEVMADAAVCCDRAEAVRLYEEAERGSNCPITLARAFNTSGGAGCGDQA